MTEDKDHVSGFDSRRLHHDSNGIEPTIGGRGQSVANSPAAPDCPHSNVERDDDLGGWRCWDCFAILSSSPGLVSPPLRPSAAGTVASIQAAACAVPGVVMCMVSPELNGDDVVVVTLIDATRTDREAVRAAIKDATPLAVASRVTFAVELPDELAPQPPPANPPRGEPVWPLVIAEAEDGGEDPRLVALMRARDAQGRAKYGVPLSTHDGRNTAMDALQEALDLIAYLRKFDRERGGGTYWTGRARDAGAIALQLINEIEQEAAR